MRVRYSGIPVVVAPHGLSLGGGCEMSLHADAVQAAAETYTGLVEVGVGLIPGGGGTKEMTKRASERYVKDDVELNALREYYLTIGMAKVATSAHEAFERRWIRVEFPTRRRQHQHHRQELKSFTPVSPPASSHSADAFTMGTP